MGATPSATQNTYTYDDADQNTFYTEFHYVKKDDGTYSSYKWSPSGKRFVTMQNDVTPPSGSKFVYSTVSNFNTAKDQANETAEGRSTDFGAPSLEASDFLDAEGNSLTRDEVVKKLHEKFPDADVDDLKQLVETEFPKYQGMSEEEKGFLADEREFSERQAGSTLGYGQETRDLTLQQSTDAYDLGVSAVGRQESGIKEAYGLGVSAAGRGREAAQESFGLAMSGAKRGLQSGLGQLQSQAGQAGAQMRGAYGGMGGGMRGAIGGQKSLAKGLESTYGIYTDQQTAATGALGRAEGAYQDEMTRLSGTRERGLGAVADERTRLTQGLGYAETTHDIGTRQAGSAYDLSMDRAALAEERGLYNLEQGAFADWETDIKGFVNDPLFYGKEGGRVPSKKTFLDVLSKIPDAKGS